ncbi:MAG: magnesium-transporting ATPase [Hapalosiphonaceae cyanobacterium JJU2]|nr:MAG: magnesium-transporting ATPase [Hapalosiphonaceae cyanobacterium JJU2]
MPSPMTTSNSSSVSDTATAWHTIEIEESLLLLDSDRNVGLTNQQAIARLQRYGHNELQEQSGRSSLSILIDQFTNIMLLMLMAVAVVSAILDLRSAEFPKDAIAISAIVILNGLLGFMQENRAEKALVALKRLSSPKVRVIRDGRIIEVQAKELVPGDVMLLEAGMQIAADGRLLECQNLQVREAALTGEALAVSKREQMQLPTDVPLGDRINMVFQGTEVVQGRGKVLVTATGMQTELGRIAKMLQSVEAEPTPMQQRMSQLAKALVTGSLIIVAVVVLGGILRTGSLRYFEEVLEVSLSMAVAVVPEGLPAVITVTLAIGTQRMVRRHALIRKLAAVETLGSVTTICSDKTGTLTQNKMVVQWVHSASHSFKVTGDGYAPIGTFELHQFQSQIGIHTEQLPPPVDVLPDIFDSNENRSNLLDRPPFEVIFKTTDSLAGGDSERTPQEVPPKVINPDEYPELQTLLVACVLCNDAVLDYEQNQWEILGDPTEGALLSLAGKAGIEKTRFERLFPRVAEFPFSSERKRMSVIVETDECVVFSQQLNSASAEDSAYLMFTKGSPELVLGLCTLYQDGDSTPQTLYDGARARATERTQPLSDRQRAHILEQNNQMASKGLRVLGLAYKPLKTLPSEGSEETTEQELIWLGLVGMLDAPRPEAREAVRRCQEAGIRPVMITGDHQLTATAIAYDLGIAKQGDIVLNGQDLEKLQIVELEQQVNYVSVYARVSPEHKLRIVQALKKRGQLVAMTGDGVNDAPALRRADIGIAMGITGTDVSKEASDMVLLDDNFATIVAAIEEGRVVYDNIRRFIKYILGSNVGEVLTVAAAPLLGLGGVPLSPLQILWMNLVTDGLPALALAMEPAEPDVMRRPPYNPHESIFARGLGLYIIRIGIIFAILTIALMAWAYNYTQNSGEPDRWKTMVFTSLCLAQMGHALAIRSNTQLTLQLNPFSNPYVLAAITLTTVLQLMLVYVAPLRNFFDTHWLNSIELAISIGFSALMFVWIELEKLFMKWFFSH